MDQLIPKPQKALLILSNMLKGDQEVLRDAQVVLVELQLQEVGMMLLKPNKKRLDKSEMIGKVKRKELNLEEHLILIHGVKIQTQTKANMKIAEVSNAMNRSQRNYLSNRLSEERKQSKVLYLPILE